LDTGQAQRLVGAMRAEGEELFALVREAEQELLQGLIKNPNLGEAHLIALLKRPKLGEGVLRAIYRAPRATASRRVKIALAGYPGIPPSLLNEILGQLFLLELAEVARLSGAPADHKAAAQQAILKRLPDSELGTRITLARRASAKVLEALLAEGESRLVAAVLVNPKLTEANLLTFLRSPGATADTISAVLRHPRWGTHPKLRLAALENRKTPAIWFTLILPALSTGEINRLLSAQGYHFRQVEALKEELANRTKQGTHLQTT
jgi:hypothetical protein